MSSLPFPLRLAAGVIATSIDTARHLPSELPSIGVRLAGTAAKLAMQVRNEITALALRGDELLERSRDAEEKPAWATFDDDADDDKSDEPAIPAAAPARRADPAAVPDTGIGDDAPGWSDPALGDGAAQNDAASGGAAQDDAAQHGAAQHDPAQHGAATRVELVPGYYTLTLAQLRSRIAKFDVEELQFLLRAETRGPNRPAFITLLTNRISTVEHAGS